MAPAARVKPNAGGGGSGGGGGPAHKKEETDKMRGGQDERAGRGRTVRFHALYRTQAAAVAQQHQQ